MAKKDKPWRPTRTAKMRVMASPLERALHLAERGEITAREAFLQAIVDGIDPSAALTMGVDEFFASRLVVKDKTGRNVPFVLNPVQWRFMKDRTRYDIIVKARQMGFSTEIQGDRAMKLVQKRGIACVTIADNAENTAHLVDIFKRFYHYLPKREKPAIKNRYPLGFDFPDVDSNVYIGTAGNRTWGRGKTVHYVHGSEVAYWPDAKTTLSGLLQAVPETPDVDVHVVLESTANGRGGHFYSLVQESLKGLNDWKVHFYPWWWDGGYRAPLEPNESIELDDEELALRRRVQTEYGLTLQKEHFNWRRSKRRQLGTLYQQEYPESLTQAFLHSGRPVFNVAELERRINLQCQSPVYEDLPIRVGEHAFNQLRIYERPIPGHQYVIGADTSEGIIVSDEGETDYSAAVVRHYRTNRQVATLQGKFTPYEFAAVLHALGKAYGWALLGVERNNHGHSVLGFLIYGTADGKIQTYPRLYVDPVDERPGWRTTSATRPVMIDDLAAEYANLGAYHINDERIVDEAMSFVFDNAGRTGAMPGAFDDLVIADAIASQMRLRLYNITEVVYDPVRIGDFSGGGWGL